MALIGIYSGRKIKAMAAKGERLTRTQTAKQALSAIKTKYDGVIVDNALYYHAGAGKWVRRSKEADKRTTSKVTMQKSVWRSRPHKYDYPGIDTAPDHKTPSKEKLINYSLRNRKHLLKSVVTGENGGKNVKMVVSGQTIRIKYTDGPSVDKLIKMSFPGIVKICKDDIYKAYKITVPSNDFYILVDRAFSPTVLRYISNTGDTTFNLDTKSISKAAFTKINSSPKSKPGYGKLKPAAKGRYRYGSFMRPLWAGFKVSVPFTLGKPGKSDEDPRRGRLPHDILITNKLIPPKEVSAYELTDMRDIQKLREMYSYIDSFGISEKNRGHLKRLYNTGKVKTKGDVDALVKKVMKPKVKSGPLYTPQIPDEVIILIGNGKIQEAETKFVSVYMKANTKVRYDDPRIKKAFDDFVKKAVLDFMEQSKTAFKMNRLLDSRLMFRSAWYAQGKPRDDEKIEAAYKTQIVKAKQKRKTEVKQIAETAKRTKSTVIKEAHEDWDEQAKALMLYKRPFNDKTLKACVNRHLKAAGY